MSSGTTRRGFLRRGVGVAGGMATLGLTRGPLVLAGPAPSDKLGVAVVGAGGMGGYSVDCALRERCVAYADIDERKIGEAMKKATDRLKDGQPMPKVFYDYRKMLDAHHKDIDVVLVGTPDHHHAPAAIRAIQLGKAAFAQKPLAHDIRECYELAKATRKYRVHTQMGNQGHCGEHIRRLVECIWGGAVGDVTETHTVLGRNFGGSGGRPPSKPVPQGIHWDEWVGPAPYRDYHDGLHPFSWRNWRQFGTGTLGDMACHHMDGLFWALRIAKARRFTVECLSQKNGSEEKFPQDNVLCWEIPARAGLPPAKVYTYDHGNLKPEVMRAAERENDRKFGEFTLFVGEKGLIGSDARILPEEKHKQFKAPPKSLPRAHGGPIEDLFHACKHGTPACSNFVTASGPLTAFILTGHLAMFAGVGKKIEWDVKRMECTNLPEINQFVRRTYRKGWEV